MESTKKTEDISAVTSPQLLRTPASLVSSISSPTAFGVSLTKERSNERNGGKSNPRTPASLPFDRYSPIRSQRNPISRTQSYATGGIFTPRGLSTANQSPTREPVDETARTNALWAEMRATLAEVETLAVGSAQQTHFFGPQHATALEELRTAQIALAQAWARADSDLSEDVVNDMAKDETAGESVKGGSVLQNDESSAARQTSKDRPRNRASSANSTGSISLDASSSAAERDVASARLRREANDEYFYRVSQGVTDVVGKLEEVTRAMDRVERASRSVWSDEEDSVQGEQTNRTSSADRNQQEKKSK